MEKGYLSLKKSPTTSFKKLMFDLGLTYETLFKIGEKFKLIKKAQNEAYSGASLIKKLLKSKW